MSDARVGAGVGLATAAHERLAGRLSGLADRTARSASQLPGWTVGHVLTHLARNADGHVRRLEGALEGRDVSRYSGPEERDRDIEAGAGRPAADLVADLVEAQRRLERTWQRHEEAGWPNSGFRADDHWSIPESPWRRLREVEMHHVDLGLGYGPADWPAEYVAWDLPNLLATVPDRIDRADQAQVLAWLSGRAPQPARLALAPWT